jgi:hypothetical protein
MPAQRKHERGRGRGAHGHSLGDAVGPTAMGTGTEDHTAGAPAGAAGLR